MIRSFAIAAAVGLAFSASAFAQERPAPATITAAGDGPYLAPGASRNWLARSVSPELTPVEQRVSRTGQITVAAVGARRARRHTGSTAAPQVAPTGIT